MKKKGRERGEREREGERKKEKRRRGRETMKINVYLIFKEVIEDFYVFN